MTAETTLQGTLQRMRIDKWLWAARLYKTRAIASKELELGRVLVNGHPCKPSRDLRGEEILVVRQGASVRTLKVVSLALQRGPASVAQRLYEETPESVALGVSQREQLRLAPEPAFDLHQGRPTKRQRRELDRSWNERWSASSD